MWILPKQLHTSAFVADTKALGLDNGVVPATAAKAFITLIQRLV